MVNPGEYILTCVPTPDRDEDWMQRGSQRLRQFYSLIGIRSARADRERTEDSDAE